MTAGTLQRSLEFRELVSLVMQVNGINVQPKRPRNRGSKFGDLLAQPEQPASDLVGLPDWTVSVRHQRERPISKALNEVEKDAGFDGTSRAAVIWNRPEYEAEDSIVVMSLRTFMAVLKDELGRQT
ncbi:hypothetical protein BH11ACT5_BH11ACT5_02660 [soil metagenome]